MVEYTGRNQLSPAGVVLGLPGVVVGKDVLILECVSPISYGSATHAVRLKLKITAEIYIRTVVILFAGLLGDMWNVNDTATRVLWFRNQPYL